MSADASPRSIWDHSSLFLELCEARASGRAPITDSVAQAVELLRTRTRAGETLLDVGCAAGHAQPALAPLGLQYRGIDSCAAAIDIGRRALQARGIDPAMLQPIALEALPLDAQYDVVLCLNTLYYFPMFHQPLEVMARAARRWLAIRSSFGERTEIRYLPDTWLDEGYDATRAYFNIFSRGEVQAFLESEGFAVQWIQDRRQRERFGGAPEVVAGISLPAEFLLAERVSPPPSREQIWGRHFAANVRRRPAPGEHGR